MGNSITKYRNEKLLSIIIELEQICYFPGETLSGKLLLVAKDKLENKILTNTSVSIKLEELQRYSYSTGSGKHRRTVVITDNKILNESSQSFDDYLNSNLSTGVLIPFNFLIPLNSHPTIFYNTKFIKHALIIELPFYQSKNSVYIIIKNPQLFTNFNELYKEPLEETNTISKSKGNIIVSLKSTKNSLNYRELIPIELIIDYNDSDLQLKGVRVCILRNVRFNKKDTGVLFRNHFSEMSNKLIKLPLMAKKHIIKDYIQFDEKSNKTSGFPPDVYNFLNNQKLLKIDCELNSMELLPTSIGGLINVEYFIKIELLFKGALVRNETLLFPIDFYESKEDSKINFNSTQIKDNSSNKENLTENTDSNENEESLKVSNKNKNTTQGSVTNNDDGKITNNGFTEEGWEEDDSWFVIKKNSL